MLPRFYQDLEKYLEPNMVVVVYGPRQVGKTTLLKNLLKSTELKYKLDSGDNLSTQEILSSQNFKKILDYVSGYELLAIDEAQHIPNVGMGLKIIVDQVPGIKVIVTGSSSFALSGQIGEPLTGRKKTLTLYPLSQIELVGMSNRFEVQSELSEYLVYGGYPKVQTRKTLKEKREVLEEIVESYLLRDILELEKVKGSKILLDLLRLVAFQIGSEVSLRELATQLGIDYKTVARYLDLFEKSFVLFNLRGYSRNLRKEVTKKSKYYYWDLGVRNAVIRNFNDLGVRNDAGAMWENFLVIERLKKQEYRGIFSNNYFWRTWEQSEVDWVEERGGKLWGYEFSFSGKRRKAPAKWVETYREAEFEVINKSNYLDFVV